MFSQSLSASPSYFPEPHWWSEISSLSKVILILGKARSCRVPNLGCRVSKSPGWSYVLPKKSALDVMHEQAYCHDEAANHQLPIAVAFWIIWIISAEECSSLTQNLMQIHCSSSSVILNVMTTQYACSLNGVYHPHGLVWWSCHCSHMYIHNSPLFLASRLLQSAANYSHNINSGWTFSGQTICILFLGRLYISNDSGEPFPPDSMVAGEGSCTKCSRNQKDDCIGTEYAKIWKDKKNV